MSSYVVRDTGVLDMNGLVSALAARKGAGTEAASISSQVLICSPYLRKKNKRSPRQRGADEV